MLVLAQQMAQQAVQGEIVGSPAAILTEFRQMAERRGPGGQEEI